MVSRWGGVSGGWRGFVGFGSLEGFRVFWVVVKGILCIDFMDCDFVR